MAFFKTSQKIVFLATLLSRLFGSNSYESYLLDNFEHEKLNREKLIGQHNR